jgi:hypothetical protein
MKLPLDNFDDVKKLPVEIFDNIMLMDMKHLSFNTRMNHLVGSGIITPQAAEMAKSEVSNHRQAIENFWTEETA